jgi:hypothetical protein
MPDVEQCQDVLDVVRADHADGSPFSLQEVIAAAASPLISGDASPPSESDVRMIVKSWEWRRIVRASDGGEMYFWLREVVH